MADKKPDLAKLKKVGMIQQKQKEYFALRIRCLAGDLTSKQLITVGNVAEKYGKGEAHLSTRQGIEIHWVHYSNLETARKELEDVGLEMGVCGPRTRVVVACPGSATCRWGIIETKGLAKELDARYFRKETPHKFKLGTTGCPHNCAKASENDIGVMGGIDPVWDKPSCIDCNLCVNVCPTSAITKEGEDYILHEDKCINCSICTKTCPSNSWQIKKQGYVVVIGGTMGKIPRIATKLTGVIETQEETMKYVESAFQYYKNHGRKKERFGHLIDRIGVDAVKEEILNGI